MSIALSIVVPYINPANYFLGLKLTTPKDYVNITWSGWCEIYQLFQFRCPLPTAYVGLFEKGVLAVVHHYHQLVVLSKIWGIWLVLNFKKLVEVTKLYVFMVNVLQFWTLFLFCSQIKCWFSGLEFMKCLSEYQTGKTLIRLLLQKQPDLDLPCWFWHLWRRK